MSLSKPVIYDGQQQRILQQGDTLALGEFDAANAIVGASTITAAMIASGFLNRTGVAGGGFADTLDTAANVLAGLINQNNNGVQAGTSFRWRYKNNATTQTATVTAGTGWTAVGTMTVATNAWRDFLITVQNSTPSQIIPASIINASAVVLFLGTNGNAAITNNITPGANVSGTNIPAATTVLSVQPGIGVTLSANATGTLNPVALTFGPALTISNEGGGTL